MLTLGILASDRLTTGSTGDLRLALLGTLGVLLLAVGVALELCRGGGVLEGLLHCWLRWGCDVIERDRESERENESLGVGGEEGTNVQSLSPEVIL